VVLEFGSRNRPPHNGINQRRQVVAGRAIAALYFNWMGRRKAPARSTRYGAFPAPSDDQNRLVRPVPLYRPTN